jgi:conjugative transfer signal peptidase TraF
MDRKFGLRSREKKLFRKLSRGEKTWAIVVLAALLTGAWLPERIIVSTSPSLDNRIFFLTKTKAAIKNGDYLVFKHRDTSFVRKGIDQANDRLLKKVGCSSGEMLLVNTKKTFFCGSKELGTALDVDSKGRPLPVFDFTGVVPDNSYFMVGTNPRSFDSRYFGFIHADEILYKALPIW